MVERIEKKTFGACTINHLSPFVKEGWPKKINIVVSFEEALKLKLALEASLLDLNKLNRSYAENKRRGVNVCLHIDVHRLSVNHANTKNTS